MCKHYCQAISTSNTESLGTRLLIHMNIKHHVHSCTHDSEASWLGRTTLFGSFVTWMVERMGWGEGFSAEQSQQLAALKLVTPPFSVCIDHNSFKELGEAWEQRLQVLMCVLLLC